MTGSGQAAAMPNRWFIALMGIALQVCLGTAYAWSYFQKPLADAFGWSNALTAWAFCLAICCLGLSAAWGGVKLATVGPATLAMTGGALFGLGYLIAAVALHIASPWLLFFGYGVVGGCGLGLGYVTPVATVARWFPDKRGLATGLVVMGFGLGALVMSKLVAPLLFAYFRAGVELVYVVRDGMLTLQNPEALQAILAKLFAVLGVLFSVLTVPIGWCLGNPPADYAPPARTPLDPAHVPADPADHPGGAATIRACLLSRSFLLMWLVFFCNITAGIAVIGFQSPLFQRLLQAADATLDAESLAASGATLIGATSLFNGVGRCLWGGLSDTIGRVRTFSIMLGSQVMAFGVLAHTGNPWLFAGLLCYVLLCYGGGFGTMPSLVLDRFGARRMPVVYGAMLTAWSLAGIVGPQMVAIIADRWPMEAGYYSFLGGAGFVVVGFGVTLLFRETTSVRGCGRTDSRATGA